MRLPDGTMTDCRDILPERLKIGSAQLINLERRRLPKLPPNPIPPTLQHHTPWKKVWKPKVPPQWNQTYYLLLNEAHYTAERAAKYKDTRNPPLCSCGALETELHLFWDCQYVQQE